MVAELHELITGTCAKDTSSDPKGWSEDNPTWGHCAVVALTIQDIKGGELLRGSLDDERYARLQSHYWNLDPNGDEWDFTYDQFRQGYPQMIGQLRPRAYVLSNLDTNGRYRLYLSRFTKAISDNV